MIRLFVTGGTFDKEYNELNGQLQFRETNLPQLLELGRCRLDVCIETMMLVDSLEMTEEQRQEIGRRCIQVPEKRIVITHGTDTMSKTALYLESLKIPKTIILTGAMIPIRFGSSDGLFNLGSALAFSQSLDHGVYIAMNGRFFNAGNVKKNRESGCFEEEGISG